MARYQAMRRSLWPALLCAAALSACALPHADAPGQAIENSLGMRLVRIPAGEFLMGSDEPIEVLAQAGHTYQLQQRGGLASGARQAVGASQTPTQDGVIRFGPLASLGIPSQYFQVLVE